VIAEIWTDAVEMGAAARIGRGRAQALRMMRTDAFHLLVLFRLRALMRRWHIPLLNRHLRLCQMMFGGVELGDHVTLGRGVYFIHSLGTVVGGTARIGDRVRFMGNNTVGTARDNGYPVIEDDVELGAGARVLGPVRIGAGAVIGANSVVLSDIPDGAVAVGAPARVVRPAPRATVAAAGLRLLATREA
jgi:serine O-acetyltransferase